MKIVVPSTGPAADQRTVDYLANIAERLDAQLIVLYILSEDESVAIGEQRLRPFLETAATSNITVTPIIKSGDVVGRIMEVASENAADLIILGVSHGEIVAEWMNAGAGDKSDIPVLLIPKWVPAPIKTASQG